MPYFKNKLVSKCPDGYIENYKNQCVPLPNLELGMKFDINNNLIVYHSDNRPDPDPDPQPDPQPDPDPDPQPDPDPDDVNEGVNTGLITGGVIGTVGGATALQLLFNHLKKQQIRRDIGDFSPRDVPDGYEISPADIEELRRIPADQRASSDVGQRIIQNERTVRGRGRLQRGRGQYTNPAQQQRIDEANEMLRRREINRLEAEEQQIEEFNLDDLIDDVVEDTTIPTVEELEKMAALDDPEYYDKLLKATEEFENDADLFDPLLRETQQYEDIQEYKRLLEANRRVAVEQEQRFAAMEGDEILRDLGLLEGEGAEKKLIREISPEEEADNVLREMGFLEGEGAETKLAIPQENKDFAIAQELEDEEILKLQKEIDMGLSENVEPTVEINYDDLLDDMLLDVGEAETATTETIISSVAEREASTTLGEIMGADLLPSQIIADLGIASFQSAQSGNTGLAIAEGTGAGLGAAGVLYGAGAIVGGGLLVAGAAVAGINYLAEEGVYDLINTALDSDSSYMNKQLKQGTHQMTDREIRIQKDRLQTQTNYYRKQRDRLDASAEDRKKAKLYQQIIDTNKQQLKIIKKAENQGRSVNMVVEDGTPQALFLSLKDDEIDRYIQQNPDWEDKGLIDPRIAKLYGFDKIDIKGDYEINADGSTLERLTKENVDDEIERLEKSDDVNDKENLKNLKIYKGQPNEINKLVNKNGRVSYYQVKTEQEVEDYINQQIKKAESGKPYQTTSGMVLKAQGVPPDASSRNPEELKRVLNQYQSYEKIESYNNDMDNIKRVYDDTLPINERIQALNKANKYFTEEEGSQLAIDIYSRREPTIIIEEMERMNIREEHDDALEFHTTNVVSEDPVFEEEFVAEESENNND